MKKEQKLILNQIKKEIGLPTQVKTNISALVKAQEKILEARCSGRYEGEKLSLLRNLSMDLRDREYRARRKAFEKECAALA